jgi:hypothetical protein
VREALTVSDLAAIKKSADELGASMQQMGASMYEQPDAGPEPGSEGESATDSTGESDSDSTDGDDVVDGEYEERDES